jgi:hypothetical protein
MSKLFRRPFSAVLLTTLASATTLSFVGCSTFETAFQSPRGEPVAEGHSKGDSLSQRRGDASEHAASGMRAPAMPVFTGGPERMDERVFSPNVVSVGLYGETSPGETPNVALQGEGNIRQVSFAAEGGDFTPDIDRTGSFLVYASKQHSESFDIYRKAVEGRTVTQITSDPSDDMMPAISPDGRQIAFVSNRTGNWDIFTMSVDGGPPTQITFESAARLRPQERPHESLGDLDGECCSALGIDLPLRGVPPALVPRCIGELPAVPAGPSAGQPLLRHLDHPSAQRPGNEPDRDRERPERRDHPAELVAGREAHRLHDRGRSGRPVG